MMKLSMAAAAAAVALWGFSGTPAMAAGTASTASMATTGQTGTCPEYFAPIGQNVSQEEAHQEAMKAFDALDTDQNDIVTRSEFEQCLAQSPAYTTSGVETRSRQDLDNMYTAMDEDKNGSLTKKEWTRESARADAEPGTCKGYPTANTGAATAGPGHAGSAGCLARD